MQKIKRFFNKHLQIRQSLIVAIVIAMLVSHIIQLHGELTGRQIELEIIGKSNDIIFENFLVQRDQNDKCHSDYLKIIGIDQSK